MVKVRTKMKPNDEIEVSDHEAKVLRGQGCLVENTKNNKPAPRSAPAASKNEES